VDVQGELRSWEDAGGLDEIAGVAIAFALLTPFFSARRNIDLGPGAGRRRLGDRRQGELGADLSNTGDTPVLSGDIHNVINRAAR